MQLKHMQYIGAARLIGLFTEKTIPYHAVTTHDDDDIYKKWETGEGGWARYSFDGPTAYTTCRFIHVPTTKYLYFYCISIAMNFIDNFW